MSGKKLDAKMIADAIETIHDPEPEMAPQTANALITGAPCADEQLHAARRHFLAVEALLTISGPRFANARRDAAGLHNKAVQRLRESLADRQAREQRHREAAAGLTELEVG